MSAPHALVIHGADSLSSVPGSERLAGQVEVRLASSPQALREALPGAAMLLGWDFKASDVRAAWHHADRLQWIHWSGAGVDALLFDELVESDVVLTNARGVFDRAMAEYVLGLVIAFAKHLPATIRLQQAGEWRHRLTERIEGRSALIVGPGSIGRAIGRLLGAAGMAVSAVGRTAREGDPDLGTIHAIESLDACLAGADFVVLVAPLTPRTEGLFDAGRFAAMKPGARFINVGRGPVVDEDALVGALEAGHLGGAALDVFRTEPLPRSSPLWAMENVVVSPHMSGDFNESHQVLAEIFYANLDRFLAGERLENVVDKRQGFVPS